MGLEPYEANRGDQNAAAPWRDAQGQNRSAARTDQARGPADPVVLPGARCRLYYRLLSKALLRIRFRKISARRIIREVGGSGKPIGFRSPPSDAPDHDTTPPRGRYIYRSLRG